MSLLTVPTDPLNAFQDLLGTPYRDRGETPEAGFDCLGLCLYVYRQCGVPLPSAWAGLLRHFHPATPPYAFGDIAIFRRAYGFRRHLGVVLQWPWFLHSSPATNGVGRSDVRREPWASCLVRAVRLVTPLEAPPCD